MIAEVKMGHSGKTAGDKPDTLAVVFAGDGSRLQQVAQGNSAE
jgi:hypothetical protein